MKPTLSLALLLAAIAAAAQQPKPLRVLLMPYETNSAIGQRTSKAAPAYWAAWSKDAESLAKAGVLGGGNALQPAQKGRHLLANGSSFVSGSYTKRPAQFSGYFILNVRDLAQAEAWARKCPALRQGGAVDLWPMMPKMGPKPGAGE